MKLLKDFVKSTGHVNLFGPPAPRLGMSIVSANGPLGPRTISLLLWLTGASMFALGMTLKGIRIKTGVFSHQGTTSQTSRSKENEMSSTLEFILDSNISSTSWLAVLNKVSRKKVQQQRCIEAILRSSSVIYRTEAALSISMIIASAGVVSLKHLNMYSPVGMYSVRLAWRSTDATKLERVSVFTNVLSNHTQYVNLDRYTSCLRWQGSVCLCWTSIVSSLSPSEFC